MNRFHLTALTAVLMVAVLVMAAGAFAAGPAPAATKGVKIAQAANQRPNRAARMEQMRQMFAQRMKTAGASDEDAAAIEAFQNEKRQALQEVGQKRQALRQASGETATDEDAKAAIADYLKAAEAAKEHVKQLQDKLTADIGLDAKPKLHAFLLAFGILDAGVPSGGWGAFGGMRGPRGPQR